MVCPYYCFSVDWGTFALESKHAKDLGVYIFYEIVLDFLVYLENNPLSDIYFINIVSCGLCLSFVNKVFHRFNF